MFRLSDATRRLVTTGLFVLLCVVPTVIVISVGVWRCLPGRTQAEERRLTFLFGQPVRVESVRHLHPNATTYEGLEILDPESHEVLVRCDRLGVERGSFRPKGTKKDHEQLRLEVGELTITAKSSERLRPMVDRLLRRRIEGAMPHAFLGVKRLVVKQSNDEEFQGGQVEAWATLRPEESKVDIRLRLEELGEAAPVTLSVIRNRRYKPAVDGFVLATRDAALPCSLLATVMPPFPKLGQGSNFRGTIFADHVPVGCRLDGQAFQWHGWNLRVEGTLENIDLRELAAKHVPHEVSGRGMLQLTRLVYKAGRIDSLIGKLKAVDGSVSRALVNSCVSELGFKTAHPISGYAPLPYLELGIGFQLDGSGLALSGLCSAEPSGALLIGTYTERIDPPDAAHGWIPPAKAIAAFVGSPGEDYLSVSRRAAPMLQRMPYLPLAARATIAAPQSGPSSISRH